MLNFATAALAAIALATIAAATRAQPVQERDCHVRVLQTLTDDLGNKWEKGKILPVNILRKDQKGASFCAHGGACMARMLNGVQATQLTDCRVGPSIGNGDFRLVPRTTSAN